MTENNTQDFRELQSGTILCNGKYTIDKKIGEGGFGITYKAVQNGLGKIVCIKEYFPAGQCFRNAQAKTVHLQGMSGAVFEKFRQAFIKEAKTLAALKHPNIVEVVDIFDENNTSYMVMTFIEGQNLQNIVNKQGKLPYVETVNYIAQLANAVGYIHDRKIYHRDIKPENVMITPDKKAILIDFGSARDVERINYTVIQRTAHYAPIEQYNANSPKGNYTDIYSIGATFYFAITGKVPFDATERLSEDKKMPEPKELNPAIPNEGNRTILKAMQIKPENRYQNIKEFMDDLLGMGGKKVENKKNNQPFIWVGMGLLVFAFILLLIFLLKGRMNNSQLTQEKTDSVKTQVDQLNKPSTENNNKKTVIEDTIVENKVQKNEDEQPTQMDEVEQPAQKNDDQQLTQKEEAIKKQQQENIIHQREIEKLILKNNLNQANEAFNSAQYEKAFEIYKKIPNDDTGYNNFITKAKTLIPITGYDDFVKKLLLKAKELKSTGEVNNLLSNYN